MPLEIWIAIVLAAVGAVLIAKIRKGGVDVKKYRTNTFTPVKGKTVENDKLIVVKNTTREKLKKELIEFTKLYNSEGFKVYLRMTDICEEEFMITFPYGVGFEFFCYLIDYITFPDKESGRVPYINGWTEARAKDDWIPDDIVGRKVMLYVPESEKEHTNVYVTSENYRCYKFDFGGQTIPLQQIARVYEERPNYILSDLAGKPTEDFE